MTNDELSVLILPWAKAHHPVLAYFCLTLYERFVEGQHYVETIK